MLAFHNNMVRDSILPGIKKELQIVFSLNGLFKIVLAGKNMSFIDLGETPQGTKVSVFLERFAEQWNLKSNYSLTI